MKEKVYIDSTIPSYYFDERESLQPFVKITRRWWDEEAIKYFTSVSNEVFRELQEGDYPNKEKIIQWTQDLPVLDYFDDLDEITQIYIDNFVMPNSMIGDAIHLAYASYYNMDYLLTWNCRHLANINKRSHIRIINERLGLDSPEIVTPMVLIGEDADVYE